MRATANLLMELHERIFGDILGCGEGRENGRGDEEVEEEEDDDDDDVEDGEESR